MNKKDLILFEEEIATLFNSGKIRAPVHLYKGNEEKILYLGKHKDIDLPAKISFLTSFAGTPFSKH